MSHARFHVCLISLVNFGVSERMCVFIYMNGLLNSMKIKAIKKNNNTTHPWPKKIIEQHAHGAVSMCSFLFHNFTFIHFPHQKLMHVSAILPDTLHMYYVLFKVHSIAIIWVCYAFDFHWRSISYTFYFSQKISFLFYDLCSIRWNRWVRDCFQSILYHIYFISVFPLWLYSKCNETMLRDDVLINSNKRKN